MLSAKKKTTGCPTEIEEDCGRDIWGDPEGWIEVWQVGSTFQAAGLAHVKALV